MGIENRSLRDEYTSRINRVIDYVDRHLAEELSLAALSKVACFSPFHFHRIFGVMTGESLNHFIQRVRVEKAATMLLAQPKASITEIAIACGLSSSAALARAFKARFQMTASQWRAGGWTSCQKEGSISGASPSSADELGQDWGVISQHFDDVTRVSQWRIRCRNQEPVWVEVREMPEFHVAYVRYTGRYQGEGEIFARLFNKLMKWAEPRGLLRQSGVKALSVYHDNPEITDDDRLRTSACITVPFGTEISGDVGAMTIPGGQYAVGHFQLTEKEYADAWYAIMGGWLPESGYQPDDRFCYELFSLDNPCQCQGKTAVDICVPVRPL